ncbi:MAG: ribosome biogenesis GTPase YlqF [Oscillospiraceae bacterium]|nr:ribosome biogenesis GTPase YlqF [Oscillospiraceae bacterium]MCR4761776.1 ribosome biogenesis GTPase YlqF [Oscillospiraceae bacterium]
MEDMKDIQWFPGHMAKTRRMIAKSLPLVDAAAELLDARLPMSSRNPELDRLTGKKPRLMILNKADMADPDVTQRWVQFYKKKGYAVITADSKSGRGVKQFAPALRELLKEQLEKYAAKGMKGRPIRVMILGIPNVGKSSLINRLAGGKRAKAEDRAGVTRTQQWIKTTDGVELLDTPGVLWPKLDDQDVAVRLAMTGAVRDDILDKEALAARLMTLLHTEYPQALEMRYKIPPELEAEGFAYLELMAKNRGMLLSGGVPNTERAAITLLDEFRGTKLGRISLEKPL